MLLYRTPAFSVGWAARSATAGGFAQTAGGSNRFGAFAGRDTFICGNAVGVDTWAAEMVLKKKKAYPGIFLEIALPFAGHNADEPACQWVQRQADLVHTVGKSKYRKAAFSERNQYMVDHSDFLIAVYMESHPRSGTAKTMEYAKKQGLKLIEISV